MSFDEIYELYHDIQGYRLAYYDSEDGGIISISSNRSIYNTYEYVININLSNNIVTSIELYFISPG